MMTSSEQAILGLIEVMLWIVHRDPAPPPPGTEEKLAALRSQLKEHADPLVSAEQVAKGTAG